MNGAFEALHANMEFRRSGAASHKNEMRWHRRREDDMIQDETAQI